jgi:heme oxygenase
MSNLASLTQAAHQNAERQEFAREMMSGNMSEAKYKTYLYNMWLIYDILEDVALSMGVFGPQDLTMPDDDLPLDGLTQADDIWADYEELGGTEANPPTVVAATEAYRSHIIANCQHDTAKLMAHVYVRHMGDLSGGQMIMAKVPGSGRMYQFADMGHSVEEMKALIKRRTTDAMAPEAEIAFAFATQIFEQLNDLTY